jgi:hypothetical protein
MEKVSYSGDRIGRRIFCRGKKLEVLRSDMKGVLLLRDVTIPDVCESHKSDEDADFVFIVTELSAQSAKATLTTAHSKEGTFDWADYCRSSCNVITVSRQTERELTLHGIPFTFSSGEYQKAY